jgi:hypothetical protein
MLSLYDSVFGCRHRRMTRPMTPVTRPGVPSGETYVVCLDCGKQFAYDWDHMRLGEPIDPASDAGVVRKEPARPRKSKLKYALIASAIPLGIVFGKAVLNKRRAAPGAQRVTPEHDRDSAMHRYVRLPNGGPGARFRIGDLVRYIEQSGRDYIIQGQVDCALADHPMPQSLDYWLRERFARNKDVKQATNEVVTALVATGLFEDVPDLKCPDSGEPGRGLRLTAQLQR